MIRRRRGRHDDTETALANFALTFAKAMLVLCVVLFVMIADETPRTEGIRPKIEAAVLVNWPKQAKVDVDTWVQDAEGHVVFFQNKEGGTVFLDRDDLGQDCVAACEEIVSLRGLVTGEYVINLNVYYALTEQGAGRQNAPLDEPLPVHVRVVQMNPVIATRWEGEVVLHSVKEEKHVVRFTVNAGKLDQFDTTRPTLLIKRPRP